MKNLIITCLFALITNFVFSQEVASASISSKDINKVTVKEKTDMLKLRKECSKNLRSYIIDNFNYPEYLLENNIGGKIKMEVRLSKTGTVEDVKIIETPHKMLSDSLSTFLLNSSYQHLNVNGKKLTTQVAFKYTLKPF